MSLEPIINLAKRRGFVWPSSEIYGGVASVYDYGPLGVELKNNLKQLWWRTFIHGRDDVVGLDTAILMHPKVWEASGHVDSFSDPMAECAKCHHRLRADHLPPKTDTAFWLCPEGGQHDLSAPRHFNLMFKTFLGATDEAAVSAYLRPETAQGMFVNFKSILDSTRQKMPFGIGQIGKAFRNEVALGNWLFRLREFDIAEIEFFVHPSDADKWFEKWVGEWERFCRLCGLDATDIKRVEKGGDDLAHYSKRTVDLHYHYPHGWDELGAVANRGDYDLKRHGEFSGRDLGYFDPETKTKYFPYVIEPTLGLDRLIMAVLCQAYGEYPHGRKGGGAKVAGETEAKAEKEIVLHLPPALAPYTAAVLPLVKKDGLSEKAEELAKKLRRQAITVFYDDAGSIGRRYRRQDEIGTPWCLTVDFQTLIDDTVTIRDRDTMAQERVAASEVAAILNEKLAQDM